MADPRQGGIALGQLLFGRADPKAGLAEEGQVYKNASALEQARIDRAKRMAYDALPEAIGGDPELGKRAALNQALATINPNLSVLAEGSLKLGDLAVQGQRSEAIDANQIPRYNQLTALQNEKPYEPVRVASGNMMPSGVALGDEAFQVMPLPQTLATIEQKEASIQQGQQRTNAAVDKAKRGPQGGKKPSTGSDEAAVLADARAAIAAGAPVAKVRARLKERGYSKLAGKL
jgi:hypothetical protein